MGSCLDGIVFGGKAKSIVSHGMKHIVAIHSQVAAINVCGGVAFRMSYMESLGGGVGEHVQHIATLSWLKFCVLSYLKGLVLFPIGLPLGLYGFKGIFCHDFPL